MKKERTAKIARILAQRPDEPQTLFRHGMRTNAEYVNLVRDQVHAHRMAAAASPLPRVRAHLLALADTLEVALDPGERPPAVN